MSWKDTLTNIFFPLWNIIWCKPSCRHELRQSTLFTPLKRAAPLISGLGKWKCVCVCIHRVSISSAIVCVCVCVLNKLFCSDFRPISQPVRKQLSLKTCYCRYVSIASKTRQGLLDWCCWL